ncbi:MAG: flagellar hook capping protein [Oscillospiraceae bacterium]|jgi:flagellar basal-body rod modification protein FlgD|nr:flagellar hook capping protein [Oscillospiraceae bacterium]
MSVYNVAAASAANQTYSGFDTVTTKKNNDVSMQDFFSLLAAQLQNQNMMNPVGDTEFLSQMAQFSALSATQELNKSFSNFMAVSYVGKNVTATQNGDDGKPTTIEGIVKSVEFSDGETFVTINDTKVSLDQITKISV